MNSTGYKYIETNGFELWDDLIEVSLFINPEAPPIQRIIWEVVYHYDYKEAVHKTEKLYRGGESKEVFAIVYRKHREKYEKNLDAVLKTVDCFDEFSAYTLREMIKEAQK